MKTYWYAAIGVILGIIIAIATGLVVTTPSGLVGAVWYGYPQAWLYKMIVAPQYNPWNVDYGNLAVDLVVWIVVFVAILALLGLLMQRRMTATTPRT